MEPSEIHRFFRVLGRALPRPAVAILTGAAAGSLLGNVRPSLDIDFAIYVERGPKGTWEDIAAAVERATQTTGISAQYSEDIERWGMITLGDYREKSLPYRRFGRVEVRLLHPAHWAIGKLGRYLEPDILDLQAVLKKRRVELEEALKLWGGALRASPRSSSLLHFRKHVEHFLRTHGRAIWGARFDSAEAIQTFHRHAGVEVE